MKFYKVDAGRLKMIQFHLKVNIGHRDFSITVFFILLLNITSFTKCQNLSCYKSYYFQNSIKIHFNNLTLNLNIWKNNKLLNV